MVDVWEVIICRMFSWILLTWVVSEADSEIRSQAQVVCLGGNPREFGWENGKWYNQGNEVDIGHINEQVTTVGNWGLIQWAHLMLHSYPAMGVVQSWGSYWWVLIQYWLRTTLGNSAALLPCFMGRVCIFFCLEETLRQKVTGAYRRKPSGGHAWEQWV